MAKPLVHLIGVTRNSDQDVQIVRNFDLGWREDLVHAGISSVLRDVYRFVMCGDTLDKAITTMSTPSGARGTENSPFPPKGFPQHCHNQRPTALSAGYLESKAVQQSSDAPEICKKGKATT